MTSFSFTQKIYQVVRTIPYGKIATYGQVAAQAGNPKAARAVGNALHNNPNLNAIKCYRVIHKDGRLSNNFAFGGLSRQAQYLMSEGIQVDVQKNKVKNMKQFMTNFSQMEQE